MAVRAQELTRSQPQVYRRILVPIVDAEESERAMSIAAQLAPEHGAQITAVNVVELPVSLPINAHMFEEEARARRVLQEVSAIGNRYGLKVTTRGARAREAGQAIVAEAKRMNADIIILSARRKAGLRRRMALFGGTVRYVLTHTPCRVMVAVPPPRT